MFAFYRGRLSLHVFSPKTTASPCLPYHRLVVPRRLLIGLHRDGLYTRAGDGTRTRDRRSLGLHRPYSGFYTIHMQCERAWQKMSRAFFTPFGKRCHVFLLVILAKDVANHTQKNEACAVAQKILVLPKGSRRRFCLSHGGCP